MGWEVGWDGMGCEMGDGMGGMGKGMGDTIHTTATSKDHISSPRPLQALKLRVSGPQWLGEHFYCWTGTLPRGYPH